MSEDKGYRDIQNFARNVRTWREERGVTVEELAQATNIAVDILRQVESGELPETLYADDLISLCRYFHKKPYEFFEDEKA